MSEDQNNQERMKNWASWDNNWATGLALILVGALFLLHTLNILNLAVYNWWAVFILIPGLNMAVKGWRDYAETSSKSSQRTGFWGLVLILIAFTFLFGMSWNYIFPAILIGVGLYILFSR